MLKYPITSVAQNLAWTRDGNVWATWRLSPQPYGLAGDEKKLEAIDALRDLLRSLRGEFLLTGMLAPEDPSTVVDRMVAGLEGFDPQVHREWKAECRATLAELAKSPTCDRLYHLSVPLRLPSNAHRLELAASSAMVQIGDLLQLPRSGHSARHIKNMQAIAEDVRRRLPQVYAPTPVTGGEQIWRGWQALTRGQRTWMPSPLDEPDILEDEDLSVRSGVSIGELTLDEGAKSDIASRELRNLNPASRRVLKVVTDLQTVSYQSMLMLADLPRGLATVGAEFLGSIDDCGYAVDWAIRGVVRSQREVLARNKKAGIQQADQADHRALDSTANSKLDRSAVDLDEYQSLMVADDLEVEIDATVMLAVAGESFEEVEKAASDIQQRQLGQSYKWSRPMGSQVQAWRAMQPGGPVGPLVREYRQIAPAESWAVAAAVTNNQVGDPSGLRLGWNVSSPIWRPLMLDLFSAATKDDSGSFAIVGDKGGGKSTMMKKVASDVASMGGRWLATDGSEPGEWAVFARSVEGSTIVSIKEPEFSLDPLRVFGPQVGQVVLQTFMLTLLNIGATEPLGVALAATARPAYLTQHGITSLGELLRHLPHSDVAHAPELADAMGVFIDPDNPSAGLARVMFDPDLPPLDLNSRAIVFWTRGLDLPDRKELENANQYRTLGPEKIFGRALFALIAKLAHIVCFADPSDLALFLVDELHRITISPEGVRVITEFVRDDRKNGAAIGVASHNARKDFPDDSLRGLFPTKVITRVRSHDLARNALEWFDADPEDPAMLEIVTKQLSPPQDKDGRVPLERRGECLIRDTRGRVGRAKVELPLLPSRRQACLSTPPARQDTKAAAEVPA